MKTCRVRKQIFRLLSLATLMASSAAMAQEPPPRIHEDDEAIFSVVWENDKFANTDSNYTNGARFSWLSAEETTPRWVRSVANTVLPIAADGKKRIGVSFGQTMYTPADLTRSDLIVDDRPYAGWTYGSVGIVSENGKRLDNAVLTVGVVGPASYAEHTQRFVHKVTDSQNPKGWDNQLNTEPGIILTMERKWRSMYEFSPFGVGVDATPYAGFDLGNINTDASVGTMFRLGYDLPADYGPPRIRPSMPGSDFFLPSQTIGGYLFAGAEGRAVGRNIFLDGNTFSDSHSVDKNYWVGTLQAGAALTYGSTRLSYTHVFMTEEFKGQDEPAQYGGLTLSMRF